MGSLFKITTGVPTHDSGCCKSPLITRHDHNTHANMPAGKKFTYLRNANTPGKRGDAISDLQNWRTQNVRSDRYTWR